jgi:hypothetical protein
LAPSGLQLGEVLLELGGALLDLRVAAVLGLALLGEDLVLDGGHVLVTLFGVHAGDHVRGEVDDLLEVLRGQVEQVPQTARNALEVRCG